MDSFIHTHPARLSVILTQQGVYLAIYSHTVYGSYVHSPFGLAVKRITSTCVKHCYDEILGSIPRTGNSTILLSFCPFFLIFIVKVYTRQGNDSMVSFFCHLQHGVSEDTRIPHPPFDIIHRFHHSSTLR